MASKNKTVRELPLHVFQPSILLPMHPPKSHNEGPQKVVADYRQTCTYTVQTCLMVVPSVGISQLLGGHLHHRAISTISPIGADTCKY